MGSCFTAGGRERDDVGREVDAGVLEGELSAAKCWKGANIRRIKRSSPISKSPRDQVQLVQSLYFIR